MGKRERKRNSLRNGSMLLEELIASCDGKCNPIRTFSAKDLIKATNNFDHRHTDITGTMYKGSLDDRPILVKRHDLALFFNFSAIRDIVIGSQMSNHKNVLKLLGCCLEFQHPAAVFEYPGNGVLSNFLYGTKGLSWKSRIKIAKEIANAVTYLHTAFPRPIIHMDLTPYNIYLDENCVAKLSNFSQSVTIPQGILPVASVRGGAVGFVDREYIETGYVTEKIDVYSFGVLLLEILTRQMCVNSHEGERYEEYVRDNVDKGRFNDIVDPRILGGGGGIEQEQQLQAFLELALRCTLPQGRNRPEMIDVAKELRQIERSIAVLVSSI